MKMVKEILKTKRLVLREMVRTDYDDLAEILQDPLVMTAYEHSFCDEEVVQWLQRQQERYRTDGFGLWAMIHRQTGEFLGQAGLTLQPCEQDTVLEIGYLLKRQYWKQGYAIEAAEGCRDYAFEILKATKVYSIIKHNNWRSQRVAEKMGMKPIKRFDYGDSLKDQKHLLYCMERIGETASKID